jgi:altronate dehydratase
MHQADHSRPGIMAIAIAVALLHLVASGCAALLAAGGRGESVGAPSPTV